ncbi:hypothetical protein ACGFIX_14495 [Nocardia salmonicida]|uniref:hypothetical protein n=1 Tax=Nocardia salmonicida TaxID=53431 RepID=UPI00371A9345
MHSDEWWYRLSPEDLERAISALLARSFPNARRIGWGKPDSGADFVVPAGPPGAFQIYQVKHFRDQLKIQHKNQIERSLNRMQTFASKQGWSVDKWTLVSARDLSSAEYEWLSRLGTTHDIQIGYIGRTSLSQDFVASYPEIVDYFAGADEMRPPTAVARYDEAIRIIVHLRNSLERYPSQTSGRGEEQLRDLLLITLNAVFRGNASGEALNRVGKTDILIRADDRNILIAECKLFDPKNKQSVKTALTNAIDQLLSYLSWRDQHCALVLFIRGGNVASILQQSIEAIQKHGNWVKNEGSVPAELYTYIFESTLDRSQHLRLTFIPFVLPS